MTHWDAYYSVVRAGNGYCSLNEASEPGEFLGWYITRQDSEPLSVNVRDQLGNSFARNFRQRQVAGRDRVLAISGSWRPVQDQI
jgi:hypothetical protein